MFLFDTRRTVTFAWVRHVKARLFTYLTRLQPTGSLDGRLDPASQGSNQEFASDGDKTGVKWGPRAEPR